MSDEEKVSEEEIIDPVKLFSPAIQKAVEGLTYIGQLSEDVKFCGHTFGLKTLRPQHRFAISLVLQPYRDTIYEVEVYRTLHVGMALTHVDNDQNFCPPIGPDIEDLARARLAYISDAETGWHTPTVEYLYARYALLELTAAKAIGELENLSQRGQPTQSPPWLDSLTEPGPSDDETSSDTQPSIPSS